MIVGAVTGYFGGWLDEILMRVNDAVAAFPSVLLALVIIMCGEPENIKLCSRWESDLSRALPELCGGSSCAAGKRIM